VQPFMGLNSNGWLPPLNANRVEVTAVANTFAYYSLEKNISVTSFILQDTDVLKHF
jgi:hypothetical protein